MIRFLLGFLFAMAICLLWMTTRFIPQQTSYETLLMRCQVEKQNILVEFTERFINGSDLSMYRHVGE